MLALARPRRDARGGNAQVAPSVTVEAVLGDQFVFFSLRKQVMLASGQVLK
ncbi:hypothetical protein [Sorangium sp. So ce362]|uniref:hypothetical protein n=1 Tax=Sorangium sp. So ce362 TaxID=3133303 RepID=UPI003F5FB562